MPYTYAYDLPFHMEVMAAIETEDGFRSWMEKWAFGCADHEAYCEKVGWNRVRQLSKIERKFTRCIV
jgi:glutaconate CoA-transferase subunit A